MKRSLVVLFLLFVGISCFSQKTVFDNPWASVTTDSDHTARLKSFEIGEDGVIVTIELQALKKIERLNIFYTDNTYIKTGDLDILRLSGVIVGDDVKACGHGTNWGWNNINEGEIRYFKLFFAGKFPSGVTNISIWDYGISKAHGWRFSNYDITNPRENFLPYYSEESVKEYIYEHNDGICGIYETIDDKGAVLACVKEGEEYFLIYFSSTSNYSNRRIWRLGDIKARMRKTASGIIKADWYDSRKNRNTVYINFDGVSMVVHDLQSREIPYLKTFPVGNNKQSSMQTSQSQGYEWTGTGFALNNGYLVTNYHVIDDATQIVVQGINDNLVEYKAELISVDKNNDLALIKINDNRFKGYGEIPYSIKELLCDVGSDIFVLGFPLTNYMGREVKLTSGIISSKSGYQGDVSTYQISAPIQPGNSGGPLFDIDGNIVGIVNSGIRNADNVGYAIKSMYLLNLVNSSVSNDIIPKKNILEGKSLSEKVKILSNFVFCIKCIN